MFPSNSSVKFTNYILETQTRRIEETLNSSRFTRLKYRLVPLYVMSACQIKREPGGNTKLVPDIALLRLLYAWLDINVLPCTNHRETSIAISGILFRCFLHLDLLLFFLCKFNHVNLSVSIYKKYCSINNKIIFFINKKWIFL